MSLPKVEIPAVDEVLARQITEEGDVKGECTRVWTADGELIVVFADGRWALYIIVKHYEGDDRLEIETNEPDISTLHNAGLIDDATWEAYRKAKREYDQAAALSRKKSEYLRLKRELGIE